MRWAGRRGSKKRHAFRAASDDARNGAQMAEVSHHVKLPRRNAAAGQHKAAAFRRATHVYRHHAIKVAAHADDESPLYAFGAASPRVTASHARRRHIRAYRRLPPIPASRSTAVYVALRAIKRRCGRCYMRMLCHFIEDDDDDDIIIIMMILRWRLRDGMMGDTRRHIDTTPID